jgi:predicted DNA-binding transcriptional regulator AlpA
MRAIRAFCACPKSSLTSNIWGKMGIAPWMTQIGASTGMQRDYSLCVGFVGDHHHLCPWATERKMMTPSARKVERTGFFTVPQFLETYAVSRSAFYRAVHRGDLSLVKLGAASRVAVADAERWAASLPRITGGANDA